MFLQWQIIDFILFFSSLLFMKLYKAISTIIQENGKEVIRTEVLINFLADYRAFEIKPTKNVLKFILKLGYGEKIYELNEVNASDKFLKINKYSYDLINNQGFNEVHVKYVFDCLCYALGWITNPPKEVQCDDSEVNEEIKHIRVGSLKINMIYVKGGTFDMGGTPEQGIFASFDEKPSVKVTLGDFFICETCVTQELWTEIMGENPSHFKGAHYPVERVSWYECQEFIEKLNNRTNLIFRFPTEAEWEYAARGGNKTSRKKYSGTDDNNVENFAWIKNNSQGTTHEVGKLNSNELGIFDLTGNVSEWCEDWYFNSYANGEEKNNPHGPSFGTCKVYRGGSWHDKKINCRVSKRFNMNPIYKNKLVGLRLAATIL